MRFTKRLVPVLLSSLACQMLAAGSANAQAGGAIVPATSQSATQSAAHRAAQKALHAALPVGLPLTFEANRGQTEDDVRFIAHTTNYSLLLKPSEAVFVIAPGHSTPDIYDPKGSKAAKQTGCTADSFPISEQIHMRLAGSRADVEMRAEGPQSGTVNYLFGNDPKAWKTAIPGYARVASHGIYPGIDLIYYGNEKQLEYDFNVAPHADPSAIRLSFEGARLVHVAPDGGLIIDTGKGETRWRRPTVYQSVSGKNVPVAARFVVAPALLAKGSTSHSPSAKRYDVCFDLGKYDHYRPLVIDPTLVYCSYLGGNADDTAAGIALDSSGNLYITGTTTSTNFPVKHAIKSTLTGYSSPFVAKMNLSASGSASLVYCTYLNGTTTPTGAAVQGDGCGIAVDSSGDTYVTGDTYATNFPTVNAFASAFPSSTMSLPFHAFVSKLSSDGSTLLYSTYYGGNGEETGYGIAVDTHGGAYITGQTLSTNLPVTSGAFKNVFDNAFVAKFNTLGTGVPSLVYSTYLGHPGTALGGCIGNRIAVDTSGNAYVVGRAWATNFPVVNGFQTEMAGIGFEDIGDGFLAKLNPTGTGLLYSTYIGGSADEQVFDVALSGSGVATIVGETNSTDFPTRNPFQANLKGAPTENYDAFVAQIDTTESGPLSLLWSSYMGGTSVDCAYSVALDASGNVYVGGLTESTNFPFTSNHLSIPDGGPANFAAKIRYDGSAIEYCTYIAGPSYANTVAGGYIGVDSSGNIYLIGSIVNGGNIYIGLPTTSNAFQTVPGGAYAENVSISKIMPDCLDLGLTESVSPVGIVVGNSLTYTVTVTNYGPSISTNTMVNTNITHSADPDDPFTYSVTSAHSAQGSVTVSGNSITSNLGTLASGASTTITVTVSTGGFGYGTVTCNSSVSSDQCDTNPTNNSATLAANVVAYQPTLASISPTTVAAGGSAFTLTATGQNFAPGSAVLWNGAVLITSYVSSTQLTAAVPASLITSVGSVTITVRNPSSFGLISNSAILLIGSAELHASVGFSLDAHGNIVTSLTLTNSGTAPAVGVQITNLTLNGVRLASGLPISVGTIAAGGSAHPTVTFPRSVGRSELATTLVIAATYSTGSYTGTIRVILP